MSADSAFQLLVHPEQDRGFSLSLLQLRSLTNGRRPEQPRRVSDLAGVALQISTEQLLEGLRGAGYRPTDLHRGRRDPLDLPEEIGVRTGLLFLALRPLSKVARMERVAAGIRRMPPEEAYYWFSKCSAKDTSEARRGQRALRVLLAPE